MLHNDKEVIQQDTAFVNIYTPNREAPKYVKQILTDLKGEIDGNTIIVGDFSTPLTSVGPETNIETSALNNILHQMDLIDIYRIFHTKATEYIFFTSGLETFPR